MNDNTAVKNPLGKNGFGITLKKLPLPTNLAAQKLMQRTQSVWQNES
jgi:hypothetical protein